MFYRVRCGILIFCFTIFYSLGNELLFEHIDFRKGLTSDNVLKVFLDKEGYLWFSTENGINRYDGYELRLIEPDVVKSGLFKESVFQAICEDKNGRLWLGTSNNGIIIMDKTGNSIKILNNDTLASQYISSNTIKDLFCDAKDRIWIATGDVVNVYLPDNEDLIFNDPKINESHINYPDTFLCRIYEDLSENIWIGS